MVVLFSQKEEVDIDKILSSSTKGISQKERVDPIEGFYSV